MRRHLLERAAEEAEPEEERSSEEQAQDLVVNAFGPRTAAWLVNRHRRQLHLTGRVRFKLKSTVLDRFTPPGRRLYWFHLAIELLRRRPGWSVTKSEHRGVISFELRWLNWCTRSRGSK